MSERSVLVTLAARERVIANQLETITELRAELSRLRAVAEAAGNVAGRKEAQCLVDYVTVDLENDIQTDPAWRFSVDTVSKWLAEIAATLEAAESGEG